jgi:hypothetical protein
MLRHIDSQNGSETAAGREPEGIIVLDNLPPDPDPQVRAFVWCPRDVDRPEVPDGRLSKPLPIWLMVGLDRLIEEPDVRTVQDGNGSSGSH